MEKRREPDWEVLPARVAERVLARASELEAARAAGTGVADLRAAAADAGISAESFDAALGELREADAAVPGPVARERRRTRVWTFIAGMAATILLLGTLIIPRLVVSAPATVTVEQIFRLSCLSSADAAELVKPLLGPSASVVTRKDSRALTVRGTPEEMEKVKAALDEKDGGAACPRR